MANDIGSVIADFVGFTVMKMQPTLFKFKDVNGYFMGHLVNFTNNESVQICFMIILHTLICDCLKCLIFFCIFVF